MICCSSAPTLPQAAHADGQYAGRSPPAAERKCGRSPSGSAQLPSPSPPRPQRPILGSFLVVASTACSARSRTRSPNRRSGCHRAGSACRHRAPHLAVEPVDQSALVKAFSSKRLCCNHCSQVSPLDARSARFANIVANRPAHRLAVLLVSDRHFLDGRGRVPCLPRAASPRSVISTLRAPRARVACCSVCWISVPAAIGIVHREYFYRLRRFRDLVDQVAAAVC